MIVLGVDIGSTKICAIIAQKSDTGTIKILGAGIAKSQGIKKGNITNIELASRSIKHAINDAKRVAGTHFDQVLVSVSGAFTKGFDSHGVVNVPSKEIGIKEINRVMQMADHNANIPAEYEKLHILPYNFKVDDHINIEDPLGMNGSRLEVQVHIITVLKSSLNNLKKALVHNDIKVVIHKWEPNERIAQVIRDAGARLAALDFMDPGLDMNGKLDPDGYIKIMRKNLETVANAFNIKQ